MRAKKQAKRIARRLLNLCVVNGALDESRVHRAAKRIAAIAGNQGRSSVLAQFLRLVRIERGRRTAAIESASPLSTDLRTAIERGLARLYGPGICAEYADRPSLIGGVRIQVGSDVYDGSVLAGIRALERRF